MKKFILKAIAFLVIIGAILLASLFLLPNNVFKNTLMGGLIEKNALLARSGSPKIILIGGSSVSYGTDSRKISEAFHMPVIDMAISADIGLKFMGDDIKPYINKGDVVVVGVENFAFAKDYPEDFEGSETLVGIIFDIDQDGKRYIDFKQWVELSAYIPQYSASKLVNLITPVFKRTGSNYLYSRKSFNQYGDSYLHWTMPNEPFADDEKCTGKEEINPDAFAYLNQFNKYVLSRGATMVIIPPATENASYQNREFFIKKVEAEFKRNRLPLIAEPSRYRFQRKYFFNMPYHLNKSGVDLRTGLVIQDLSKVILK